MPPGRGEDSTGSEAVSEVASHEDCGTRKGSLPLPQGERDRVRGNIVKLLYS